MEYQQQFGSRSRNASEKIVCVLNPMAQGGKAGRSVGRIEKALDQVFENWQLVLTEGPGHAKYLTRQAIDAGADIVAAIGGDGTCHEVVNGFFENGAPVDRRVKFALIPWGTGSDLARTIRAPSRLEDALWVAATGMTLPTDVGVARFINHNGEEETQVFINSAGLGSNGAVAAKVNAGSKKLGGTLTFLGATVSTLVSYESPDILLKWKGPSGEGVWDGPLLSAFVMNGAYCGGGMHIGPRGSMHDGLLDLVVLPPMGFVGAVARSWRLFDGSANKVRGSRALTVNSLEVSSPKGQEVLIELDGEQPGHLPLSVEVLTGVLQVRGGWIHSPYKTEAAQAWRPQ